MPAKQSKKMEVYLVKDEVKIIPVSQAFSKIEKYTGYVEVKDYYRSQEESSSDESSDDDAVSNKASTSKSGDKDGVTLLTVSKVPVTFKSICSGSDSGSQSDRFAERLERKLRKNPNVKLGNLKVELVMSTNNVEHSLGGQFVLSTVKTMNVFKRLQTRLDHDIDLEYSLEVSLCHLPNKDDPVSPDALVCLKADLNGIWNSLYEDRMRGRFLVRIPPEMKQWWEQGTGFIYSKINVKIAFGVDPVKLLYECPKMRGWAASGSTPVELVSRDGKIEKFYRKWLEDQSKVFLNKFQEMEKEGKPLKLEMNVSKNGVEKFLEYVYGHAPSSGGGLSGGALKCGLALELLQIGREYEVLVLGEAMDEIIMAKKSSDFRYFSVEGVLALFLYARDLEGLRHLRDKAVRVLRNYSKTANEKLEESKEYQNVLRGQPEIASELSQLYSQLD